MHGCAYCAQATVFGVRIRICCAMVVTIKLTPAAGSRPRLIRLTASGSAASSASASASSAASVAAATASDEDGFQVWLGNVPLSASETQVRYEIKNLGIAMPWKVLLRDSSKGRYGMAHFKLEQDALQLIASSAYWSDGAQMVARLVITYDHFTRHLPCKRSSSRLSPQCTPARIFVTA